MSENIRIHRDEDEKLRQNLEARTDSEAERIKRYLNMPDLSRTPGSPLYEITERVKNAEAFRGFDVIEIPEIVPTSISFDLFDFPQDHPARLRSDTYFIDNEHILRTHDTVFWYYYLNHPMVKERISKGEAMGTLCYGKVYRKDKHWDCDLLDEWDVRWNTYDHRWDEWGNRDDKCGGECGEYARDGG